MKKSTPDDQVYIRVGTDYFKISPQPLISGDYFKVIRRWSRLTINEDLTSAERGKITRYDSFCIIPDHLNYKRTVLVRQADGSELNSHYYGSYNKYEPLNYDPQPGPWEKTRMFLEHIFGEQYEIGIDFLTIIFRYPTQVLPILCLVSRERSTGKTTFLNWMKAIYGSNMTINTNQDFRNQFNSGWTTKLIIGVDEVLLDKLEDAERIKNYATTRSIKTEAKGKDKVEEEFFGKFILCSNNDDSFIQIPRDEIRYWVRSIPTIKQENINLLEDLIFEIPAFLYHLKSREITSENKTRMYFTREQLWTPALQKVIQGTESTVEKEIREIVIDTLMDFELEEVLFTPKDLLDELLKESPKLHVLKTEVKNVLKQWGLKQASQACRYTKHYKMKNNEGNWDTLTESKTGLPFIFKRSFFLNNQTN
ncbi:MAG: helicase [Bacteroidetes bacterium]|nr:helicase [Bacteroidota bacterium]